MSLSLSGITNGIRLAKEEGLEATAKRYLNAGHNSPKDYDTAKSGDKRFIGSPVCKWQGTKCPYGSNGKYAAKDFVLLGNRGEGGQNMIHPGQYIVICSLGRTATPDSEKGHDGNISYAVGL